MWIGHHSLLSLPYTNHQFSLSSLLASPRQRYSSSFSPVWKSWHTFWWTGEMGVRGHGMSKSRRTPRMTAWEPSGVKVHSPKAQGLVIFYQQWHGCGDLPAGLGTQQSWWVTPGCTESLCQFWDPSCILLNKEKHQNGNVRLSVPPVFSLPAFKPRLAMGMLSTSLASTPGGKTWYEMLRGREGGCFQGG